MQTASAPRRRVGGTLAARALAVFLAFHGVAHFAGTGGSLKLVDGGHADVLGGSAQLAGAAALTTLAIAWAVIGAAYLVVAVLVWIGHPMARAALIGVTAVSLALSVLQLPLAVVGVVIDVALLLGAWLIPGRLGLRQGG